jgi:TonB family protein
MKATIMKDYQIILLTFFAGGVGFLGGYAYERSRIPHWTPPASILPTGDIEPVAIERVDPIYPASAIRDGVGGTVFVEVLIDEEGFLRKVSISKGVRGDLDSSAIEAVRRWKYQPAVREHKPVTASRIIPIKFSNSKGPQSKPMYDLRCRSFAFTPEHPFSADELRFQYSIENAGTDPLLNSPFTIELFLDGKLIAGDRARRNLLAGGEVTYWIPQQNDLRRIKGGKHTYKLVIDGTNVVQESNKDNNVVEGTIEFKE